MSEADKNGAEKNKKENKKDEPNRKHGWYTAARVFGTIMVKFFTPVEYLHKDRLLDKPPYILISNHLHFLDPIFIAFCIKKYEVTFLSKKELYKNKIAAFVLNHLHTIVVDRHNTDMEAMRKCMKTLRRGEILGIFPEGTRHHNGTMAELESGVAMIALRGNAPVMPVYLDGKPKLFRKIHCYIGNPIPLDDIKEKGINKETCEEVLQRIRKTYANMAAECKKEISEKK